MADANIRPTKITTDLPGDSGELALADGFAFFQKDGRQETSRAGVSLNALDYSAEKTLDFEIFKLDFSFSMGNFFGVCGPAYALELGLDAESSYELPAGPGLPSSGELVFNSGELRGGLQIGFILAIAINLNIYRFGDKRLAGESLSIDLDLISFIIDMLLDAAYEKTNTNGSEGSQVQGADGSDPSLNEEVDPVKAASAQPHDPRPRPVIGAFGPIDYKGTAWYPERGTSTGAAPKDRILPTWSLAIDLIPLTKYIPTPGDLLYAMSRVLAPFGGGISIGPGLGFGMPLTVTITGATINNHPFDAIDTSANTSIAETKFSVTIAEQTPVDPNLVPLEEAPTEVGLLFEHEVGFELSLFFFASVSFLKVLHVGFQTGNIDIGSEDRVPGGGPFREELRFTPGGGKSPFPDPTEAPSIESYTANQPVGRWVEGVRAQYFYTWYLVQGVSNETTYESARSPVSDIPSETDRFFAHPKVVGISTDVPDVGGLDFPGPPPTGRRLYRTFLFADGSSPETEMVAQIENMTDTEFVDDDD